MKKYLSDPCEDKFEFKIDKPLGGIPSKARALEPRIKRAERKLEVEAFLWGQDNS